MTTETTTRPKTPLAAIFTVPNQLTLARFLLSIALFIFIAYQQWLWCFGVFTVAAITDWLDGYLARKLKLGSTLGRNLDPLVDKILVCGAFTFLIPFPESAITPWIATIVVTREFVVTSLRSFIENRGGNFGATWPGKLKMILQCAALLAIFLYLEVREMEPFRWGWIVRDILVYAMTAITILSGLQYLWRATVLLREE
jgi:CDP-diacylglycerol---glycerol-3-phosphate 3-phosphatidyltransferase